MKMSDKYSVPEPHKSGGYTEKTYKPVKMHHHAILTDKTATDEAYMEGWREAMADELVSAFAQFLHNNPDCIEMDKGYDAGGQQHHFNATITLLKRED